MHERGRWKPEFFSRELFEQGRAGLTLMDSPQGDTECPPLIASHPDMHRAFTCDKGKDEDGVIGMTVKWATETAITREDRRNHILDSVVNEVT